MKLNLKLAVATVTAAMALPGIALAQSACPNPPVLAIQEGTTYTPLPTDTCKLIQFTNPGAITVTVPAPNQGGIPQGYQVQFQPTAGGQITLVNGYPGFSINGQQSISYNAGAGVLLYVAGLSQKAPNWFASGSLDSANATQPAGQINFGLPSGSAVAVINPMAPKYGAKCDATTDDTTAINNAIADLMNNNGGILELGGMCKMLGAMVLPYTGTAPPSQKPLRITGAGNNFGANGSPSGGGGLDLRYDGLDGLHPAKIDTRGFGSLRIDDITIKDGGTDNFLFFQTTNTTVNMQYTHIIGNSSCNKRTCTQDAIQLGGITNASSVLATNSPTAGFQGYGSQFVGVQFDHIRHAFNFGGSANGIVITNPWINLTNGSAESDGAPFYFYGAGLGASGNQIFGGIVEIPGYPYAVTFKKLSGGSGNVLNFISGLGIYDEDIVTPVTLGVFNFADNSETLNTIIPGFLDTPLQPTAMTGMGAGLNTYINGGGTTPSTFPWGLSLGSSIPSATVLGTDSSGKIQATTTIGTGSVLRQSNSTLLSPIFGNGTGLQSAVISGANSGNANGSVLVYNYGGVTKNSIGGYSAVLGGSTAFNKDLTFFDADFAYHFYGLNSIGLLGTDSTGKLQSQPTLGSGSSILGASAISIWVPSDASGASLTFTTADTNYYQLGKICVVSGSITYPSTGSGATAAVGGLPCISHNGSGILSAGSIDAGGIGTISSVLLNNSTAMVFHNSIGASLTNANLTGDTLRFTLTYLTN